MSTPSEHMPFRVRLAPIHIAQVPEELLPYVSASTYETTDGLPVDSEGVRMFVADGRQYDHPVAQAQYALQLLSNYRLTGDREYLEIARNQADRLLERAVRQSGARYFPYEFDFARHDNQDDVMRAPWYSAMAQGQAMSVFVRLLEATDDQKYRAAADETFLSFLQVRSEGSPERIWTALVDAEGYYWPEEYAADIPDRTFNGVGFAAYGLYDYARLTGNDEAAVLFQASLTTYAHVLDGIRVPGEISRYCLAHGVQSDVYHAVHIGQLQMLTTLTGDQAFAHWAALLTSDHDPTEDSN